MARWPRAAGGEGALAGDDASQTIYTSVRFVRARSPVVPTSLSPFCHNSLDFLVVIHKSARQRACLLACLSAFL
eukprot:CAMPEP_0205939996 /NCGR_PEP_ID=MMETSP1325-20131115/51186_1 /ASSEMBLY_ACC=CAM_ASM_000708 /TAXON_ID=236786 /ORGANISM="Florenciella sp., Strain RCC1007" /LENGTH=73 /DNA_ID=CAMNT_0053310505 /DNA_START=273 /DNA_END=491 /DNA_ORIENTATION=+